jgi:methyl-accepting chemotaxis protein
MKIFGLAYKFIIPLVAIMLIAQLIGVFVTNRSAETDLQVQERATVEMVTGAQAVAQDERMKSLQVRADMIGAFLSKNAVGPILFDDKEALTAQQESAKGNGIDYVLFLTPDGKSLMVPDSDESHRGDAIEKLYPVVSKDKTIGQIAVGISKRDFEAFEKANQAELAKLTEEINKNRQAVSGHLMFSNLTTGAITLVLVITVVMFLFRTIILKPLREGRALMDELASGNGDLTIQLPVRNKDEISDMLASINNFTTKLRAMIQEIVGTSEALSASTAELTTMMHEAQTRIDHQQQETGAVASAIQEMASTVHEVARNTSTAAESAQQANDAAKNGHVTTERAVSDINGLVTRIEETAVVINRLNEDAAHVSTVLEVIRGIAEQTNLLALNAAIEAARAGEQGRGFAVVADEVRTLAGKTQQSTEEIRDIIEKLQAGSLTAVEAMNAAQTSGQQGAEQVHHVASELTNIRSLVQQINDMNTQIASAVEEQSAVATEINNNITSLNHIGEESAGSAAASAQSSMDLAELAQNLNRLAGMFKV